MYSKRRTTCSYFHDINLPWSHWLAISLNMWKPWGAFYSSFIIFVFFQWCRKIGSCSYTPDFCRISFVVLNIGFLHILSSRRSSHPMTSSKTTGILIFQPPSWEQEVNSYDWDALKMGLKITEEGELSSDSQFRFLLDEIRLRF